MQSVSIAAAKSRTYLRQKASMTFGSNLQWLRVQIVLVIIPRDFSQDRKHSCIHCLEQYLAHCKYSYVVFIAWKFQLHIVAES